MAVLSKEDLFNKIKEHVGDDTSDEAITFVEDVTDTFNDMETRLKGDGKDWKSEYETLNETWKKKYRDRFFGGVETDNALDEQEKTVQANSEKLKFKDLFEEREN